MANLAVDTFVRANQSGFGTASDGSSWTHDTGSATLSIASNEGVFASGGTDDYMHIGSGTSAPTNVLCRCRTDSNGNNVGVIARYASGPTMYRALKNNQTFYLQKIVSGSITTLGSTAYSYGATDYDWIRLVCQGTTISATIWRDGNSEPGSPTFSVTDSAITAAGNYGLTNLTGGGTSYCDHLTVTDNQSAINKDIAARFRQASANQFKDIASRFRQASSNQFKDVIGRFKQASANQIKNISLRFRQASSNQFKDISLRFLQAAAATQQVKDIATRFRQASASQLKNISLRFLQASSNQLKDIPGRFRQASANQLKNIALRFRQASANQSKDIALRFIQAAAGTQRIKDIASRFRQASSNQLKDVALRFRQASASQLKNISLKFLQGSANQFKDVSLRFRPASGNQPKDISLRFLQAAGQGAPVPSGIVLQVTGRDNVMQVTGRDNVITVPGRG